MRFQSDWLSRDTFCDDESPLHRIQPVQALIEPPSWRRVAASASLSRSLSQARCSSRIGGKAGPARFLITDPISFISPSSSTAATWRRSQSRRSSRREAIARRIRPRWAGAGRGGPGIALREVQAGIQSSSEPALDDPKVLGRLHFLRDRRTCRQAESETQEKAAEDRWAHAGLPVCIGLEGSGGTEQLAS